MKNRFGLHALLTVALTLPVAGVAADKAKTGRGFGTAAATGAYLTRDELRACLGQQTQLREHDAALLADKTAIAARRDEIATSGTALKARFEILDRSDAAAVASFNEQTLARDAQIEAYGADVAAYNTRAGAFGVEREVFAKVCGNRRFFDEDEAAIKQGK
ncbi:MAG: hypothetical protein ABIQ60_13260 [Burkholderiaceae bacterium]